ncbi:INCE protein, partial [Steatornis caripensis]|nr:INCE protein [Steatornis caripensis]
RLSRRKNSNLKLAPSVRRSQRLQNKSQELISAEVKEVSPPQRMTRSRAAMLAKTSKVLPESLPVQEVEGKVPLVEINVSDRASADLHLQKSTSKLAEKLCTAVLLSPDGGSPQESRVATSPPVPTASELMVPQTPEANDAGEGEALSKLKTAKVANTTVILSEEPGLQDINDSAHVPEGSGKEPSPCRRESPRTPTSSRLSCRRSVRRSLMGKTSMTCRSSLAEKHSLATKRKSMIRRSVTRTMATRSTTETPPVSSTCMDGKFGCHPMSLLGTFPALFNPQSPQLLLQSWTVGRNKQLQETSNNESNLNKNRETQEPPQVVRRKHSYKRAVDECYDNQQAEDGGLSPPRRKTPSPAFPASKVVRPFKTFLHTVQKNQLLMTPCSMGRHGVIKSFVRYNTPLQSDPKEKERHKLETLRKKQEAEKLRKQKLEEEKKRQQEEAKLKREERLRKMVQTRERGEQIQNERRRRVEQKIALFEKSEKVREERLAEEKMRKKAAAKKMEEAEARRRHDEGASKQKALQQEEEERRHKELMQKRKEEEQERARKIAEQRQAEQERERQRAAERELKRIQAEKLREEQERAARLRKEVLAAKEQFDKEKKEQEEQRLAEMKRQEQEQKKLLEEQKAKDTAQTQHLENKENSPVCSSYQMTPQARKGPKPPVINPNNYGMDLNSDDSTDDESQPRKPIPAWATGYQLSQAVIHQYSRLRDVEEIFGMIPSPNLEDIFRKRKPRYLKRTSSAVWSSPP